MAASLKCIHPPLTFSANLGFLSGVSFTLNISAEMFIDERILLGEGAL